MIRFFLDGKTCEEIKEKLHAIYTRGVSLNLPVLLIDVARDMYTFL